MATKSKVQPALAVSDAESAPKPEWHAPIITRIDIKRTKSTVGSFIDGLATTKMPPSK